MAARTQSAVIKRTPTNREGYVVKSHLMYFKALGYFVISVVTKQEVISSRGDVMEFSPLIGKGKITTRLEDAGRFSQRRFEFWMDKVSKGEDNEVESAIASLAAMVYEVEL